MAENFISDVEEQLEKFFKSKRGRTEENDQKRWQLGGKAADPTYIDYQNPEKET